MSHLWGRSSVWLERLPVTEKAAGSSPVAPATFNVARPHLSIDKPQRIHIYFCHTFFTPAWKGEKNGKRNNWT